MISVLYFIIQYKKPFTILLLAGTVKPRMESWIAAGDLGSRILLFQQEPNQRTRAWRNSEVIAILVYIPTRVTVDMN